MNKAESSSNFSVDTSLYSINSILESISDPFFTLDCDFRYQGFNSAHANEMKILYSSEIAIGEVILSYITVPEDCDHAKMNFEAALKGEKLFMSNHYGNPNLSKPLLESSITPIYNSTKEIIGISVYSKEIAEIRHAELSLKENILEDTTERKLIEKALQDSEDNFRAIFEGNSAAICIIEYDTTISMVNDAYCKLSGYTRQEVTGMSWTEQILPADLQRLKEYNNLRLRNPADAPDKYEFAFYRKNGEIRNALMSVALIEKSKKIIASFIDISQRKQAEKALKESEEKFRNFFEFSVLGKSMTTMDGKMKVNNAFIKIVGYTEAELNQLKWQDITHPDDLEISQTKMNLLIKGESDSASWEKRFIQKDGRIVWVDISTTLQRDEAGNPQFFITVINDITDRKLMEEDLRQSEDRYRSLFERNYSVMLILNPDTGEIVDANPAACEYYGWPYDEICRKNIAEINMLSLSEGKAILANAKLEKHVHLFFNHRLANGEIRDVEVYTTPINYGSSVLLYSIIHDITEKKLAEKKMLESEEKLSALFGSMTEMVAIHELVFNEAGDAINYRIIECNDAFSAITQIKKEDAIGRLATEVYNTETAPYLDVYSKVAISRESSGFTTYFPPMDKHFLISVVSPRLNQFATITNDISAIKQADEEVIAKNKELENYLYVASHDLRSPLVNIQGFSQRLLKQANDLKSVISEIGLNEDQKSSVDIITDELMPKTLNFILSNVSKMDSLINSLLQISRTGRLALVVKKVDMNKLFRSIISTQDFLITKHGIKLKVEEVLDCYGDENQLNQLFSNIIENAIKYRDINRPLVIEISSTEHYNKVIYRIADTGKGINSKYHDKIWDVFYRIDSTSPKLGEGIGLSIAKTIVNKHKGKIGLESEEGKGSAFYIELQGIDFFE